MRMKIISDNEAIYNILQEKDRYVCYLGAGASAEAGVMTAAGICEEIRQMLIDFELNENPNREDATQKIEAKLKWADKSKRYSMCMHVGYNTQDRRVEYFRKLLQNRRSSFCHHAVALLMASRHFKSTCLTTNFDKLLEMAFMQQGKLECQPIRNESEIKYWWPEKRRYMIKLHGDYDTDNVLNTNDETLGIKDGMKQAVRTLSQRAGMLVLGTAGNEQSIRTLFDYLTDEKAQAEKVLSNGLLWGVYMNQSRPKEVLSNRDLEDLVTQRIDDGEVGSGIAEMMERTSKRDEPFCFFPIWGAGNFMFSLIKAIKDRELKGTAELYLDREMRLWNVFQRAQLEEAAISKHIAALRAQEKKLQSNAGITEVRRKAKDIFKAQDDEGRIEIKGIYGDITSRSMMSDEEFRNVSRAVLSPEDTCLSAGGGVALGLLTKAGRFTILNELQKFSPVPHKAVAVTSGGNLPVHYIFHAASIDIHKDGEYGVSAEDVCETMREVLNKAAALEVGALWIPLMGTGVGPLGPRQSLAAILKAIATWNNKEHKLAITIVLYDEEHLLPNNVIECVEETVGPAFGVKSLYPL